ncbi:MAG: SDR family oxidoreductase [Panacagrimonas sp.]
MNEHTAVLMTGVTGFLGGRLLRRLLEQDQSVIVLCRGRRGKDERAASAHTRVEVLLKSMGCENRRSQVYVIEADLAGIAVDSLSTALRIGMQALKVERLLLVNVAASLKMDFPGQETERRQAIAALNHSTNVVGLTRVLAALDAVAASPQMSSKLISGVVHFSTCYAHGRRVGVLPEAALSDAFDTENSYERSKREGEAVLQGWQTQRPVRVPVTVIRPSIVTGPDTDDGYAAWLDVLGESVNQNRLSGWLRRLLGALPPQMRLIDLMIHSLRRACVPFVPLLGNAQGVLDFIDGDDVERYSMEVLRHHLHERLPAAVQYLQLANPEAPTLREVADMTVEAFGYGALGRRIKIIRGFWLFNLMLRLFAALPVAGVAMKKIYLRTSMLRPYLLRPQGTCFATEQTAAYFAERGVVYQPRRIDTQYVRSLIKPLPVTAPISETNAIAGPVSARMSMVGSVVLTSDSSGAP